MLFRIKSVKQTFFLYSISFLIILIPHLLYGIQKKKKMLGWSFLTDI